MTGQVSEVMELSSCNSRSTAASTSSTIWLGSTRCGSRTKSWWPRHTASLTALLWSLGNGERGLYTPVHTWGKVEQLWFPGDEVFLPLAPSTSPTWPITLRLWWHHWFFFNIQLFDNKYSKPSGKLLCVHKPPVWWLDCSEEHSELCGAQIHLTVFVEMSCDVPTSKDDIW